MTHTIVIALGGNAIMGTDPSANAQIKTIQKTASYIIPLIRAGHRLLITHGNGPQVGNILLQQYAQPSIENPSMPLDTCVAMTQGSIGYWLSNAIKRELVRENVDCQVVSLITQVIVDQYDLAFMNPTKPIGPFLDEKSAKKQATSSNEQFKEDAGRGWRKVVASPKPIGIVEGQVIKKMVSSSIVTIAGGGGGVPVSKESMSGLEAVVDKDFASEKIAEIVDADYFIMLTAVESVYINFGNPDQEKVHQLSIQQAKKYISDGQFAQGSMLPKIESAIEYLEHNPKGKVIISAIDALGKFGKEDFGTLITA